jgi:hypothetical protein
VSVFEEVSTRRRQASVDSVMDGVLSADNKLITGTILRRIFDPTERRKEHGRSSNHRRIHLATVEPPRIVEYRRSGRRRRY